MHRDLQRARDAILAATDGLNDATLAWHPPEKWSAAGILEHLARSFGGTAYIMKRCLDADCPKAKPDRWRDRVIAFIVVDLGYVPSGFEAPEMTRPTGLAPAAALDGAFDALAELDDAAARCAARFGTRVKLANHPILGAFSVRQWRRFHRVHTRHHMTQIARLRAALA